MEISDPTTAHKDTGMNEKIRILLVSANPWTTSRILVDEEERQIFEKLQEGPYRDSFELHKHSAIRSVDLQRLLMMYKPDIVHFSGHASKSQKIILGGTSGRGKEVDRQGLVDLFALYKNHVRLVLLNACFTKTQARSLSEVIDYTVGTGKGLGDKGGVAFAGAFYRALGFGKSVKEAFASAKAELGLTKMPRTKGIELFSREGIRENDPFPQAALDRNSETAAARGKLFSRLFARHVNGDDVLRGADVLFYQTSVLERMESSEAQGPVIETSSISLSSELIRYGKQSHICEHATRHVSHKQREAAAPALGLTRGDKASRSGLTGLGKTRRAKAADSHPGTGEIKLLSSTNNLRGYLVVTLRVQRAVLPDRPDVSLTQIARKDQTSRAAQSLRVKRQVVIQNGIRSVKSNTKKQTLREFDETTSGKKSLGQTT
jgi:hypothetical protein